MASAKGKVKEGKSGPNGEETGVIPAFMAKNMKGSPATKTKKGAGKKMTKKS